MRYNVKEDLLSFDSEGYPGVEKGEKIGNNCMYLTLGSFSLLRLITLSLKKEIKSC